MNQRLTIILSAACPILGVSIGTPGDNATVRIDYAPSATQAQRDAAAAALAAFDWSDVAQVAWDRQQAGVKAAASVLSPDLTDPQQVGINALFQVVCTRVNTAFADMGRPKPLLQADILADVMALFGGG